MTSRFFLTLATGFTVALLAAADLNAQAKFAWTNSSMTLDEMAAFLRTAKIVKTRGAPGGITGSSRLTLTEGSVTHEAHFQSIDEQRTEFKTDRGSELNFRDTWKFNIAAYKLDRMLEMNLVPMSVERRVGGKTGAVTWWVDDVLMDETKRNRTRTEPPDKNLWNKRINITRVFDQLIFNTDRNTGNILILKDWRIALIDHTRAFRIRRDLENPKALRQCDRQLFEKLKGLTENTLERELAQYLRPEEIKGLLARRDKIVAFFEGEIKSKGEGAVLYTMAP